MTVTAQEGREFLAFLRGRYGVRGLERLALVLDVHRTTISKKLAGAQEITLIEVAEWVEAVQTQGKGGRS